MNNRPCIFLEFDPETFELIAIYFKASNDAETELLQKILMRNFKSDEPEGCFYDA
jgi:hypothetical protein